MNMTRIWSVFIVNLRGFLRDKGGLFFTFLFPIMLMLLLGFIFAGTGDSEYTIHVQDLDGTEMSENLTSIFREVESFKVRTLSADEDPASFIKDSDANFVIVIPDGYEDTLNQRLMGDLNITGNLTVMFDELEKINHYLNKGLIDKQITDNIVNHWLKVMYSLEKEINNNLIKNFLKTYKYYDLEKKLKRIARWYATKEFLKKYLYDEPLRKVKEYYKED